MKAALIGLGMVSGTFGDAFQNTTRVTLSKVFARSSDSRRAFLENWPDLGATAADSIEEIANDGDIDFVILTTPPNARAEIVKELVRAGKPVLMEKPVERTLTAATELVELCEAEGVPLGIVFQHRKRPTAVEMKRRAPEFGPLMAVEISVPWWRAQSYYDEPGRGTYERDGGGVLLSQAIHTMDLALSFTGPVSEVTAMCATTGLHKMESEDFVAAGLRFANGAVGHLFASTASFPGRPETIVFHYRDASASLTAGELRIDRHDGTTDTFGQSATSGAGADPMAFKSDWHRFVVEDFVDALENKRPPLVPGRKALEVHRTIDAIERAAKTGTTQQLS